MPCRRCGFFFTTPGVCLPSGCPALSVPAGQFLLKDLGLLAAAIWLLATSWSMLPERRRDDQFR